MGKFSHFTIAFSLVTSLITAGCGGPINQMPEPEPAPCSAPAGKSLSDIPSLIAWINAMPKPVTLACFVQSLPRPLYGISVISGESAQPSIGDNNPRLFLFFDKLALSIVPDERYATLPSGEPKNADATKHNLLEVSYSTTGIKSLKGEIKFPVTANLSDSAPYEKLAFGANASVCSLCHRNESHVTDINGVPVYESDRLKPRDPVGFAAMRLDYEKCPSLPESYHCNMLKAIFDPGELRWQEFPAGLPDIYYQ